MARWLILVIVVAAVLVVPPAQSPVSLSYVTSDSMEPTLDVDDGFVLVSTGEISQGDIVTYWSGQKGRYVTHRVVGETDEGFLTRGDANAVTDQETGLPPVKREDVVGEVLTVGSHVLVLPNLGSVAGALGSRAHLLVGGLGAYLLASGLAGKVRSKILDRDVRTVADVVTPIVVAAVLLSMVVLVAGVSTHQLSYVATENPSAAGTGTVMVGQEANQQIDVDVEQTPFTRVLVDANGLTVENRTVNGSTIEMGVLVPPQRSPGSHVATVRVYSYPKTLPEETQRRLHAVHPAMAMFGSVGVVFAPFLLAYVLFLDGKRPIRSSRRQWVLRLRRLTR